MRATLPWVQVLRFAEEFGRAWFPLNTDYLEMMAEWHTEILEAEDEEPELTPYEILRNGIPYQLQGYSYEDFHDIFQNQRPSACLSAILVPTGDFYMMGEDEDAAAREVIRKGLASDHGLEAEQLGALPPGGYSPETVMAALRGTPLEALALEALWVIGKTGNFFLDNQVDYESEIRYGDDWKEETVQLLQEEWREAESTIRRIRELNDWMESDFPRNARDALEFLAERAAAAPENFTPGRSPAEQAEEE